MLPTLFGRSDISSLDDWFDQMLGIKSYPTLDYKEDTKAYYLQMMLPGVSSDEVKINLVDKVLTIEVHQEKSEKRHGFASNRTFDFKRAWTLPRNASDAVEAEQKDGVLLVTIPKNEEKKSEVKQISIKV